MEQLISFSLPKYIELFDNVKGLKIMPVCICYQYDIDDNNFGPFGFNTPLSEEFLNFTFSNVKFWNEEVLETIYSFLKRNKGIYFYDGFEKLEKLILEVNKYKIKLKKNAYFAKKGKPIVELSEIPLLLNIFNKNGLYESKTINKLLDMGISFYIRQHYSPEAGDTFVIFNRELIEKIKEFNKNKELNFREVDSVNELKPW